MDCTIYCCNKNDKVYNLVYSDNNNSIEKTKESKDDWACSLCQTTTSKDEKMYQIATPDKFRRVCNYCLNLDYFNIIFKNYATFIKESIVQQQQQKVDEAKQQQQEQEQSTTDYKLFVAIDNGDIYSILKIISESNEKVQPKHLNNDYLLKPLRRQYMLIILDYYSKYDYKSKPITLNSLLGQFLLYYLFEVHPHYSPQPILMHNILMQLMQLPKETTFDNVITHIDDFVFPDDDEMEKNMPSIKYYNRIRRTLLL